MRRILFVSADLPWPPDGGGRIATLRDLEAFTEFSEVDLIALADPARDLDFRPLRELCRSVTVIQHPFTFGQHRARQLAVATMSLASADAYRIRKFRSAALAKAIERQRRSRPYDLVHHDQFGVAAYRSGEAPSTIAHHNVESQIYGLAADAAGTRAGRLWSGMEARKLRRAEPRILRGFDHVFVLAEEDAELLRSMGVERLSVLTMPVSSTGPAPSRPPAGRRILALGSMSWFGVEDGLLWFRREIWPRIVAQIPDATWDVVGPNAGPAIRQMATSPGIVLHGYLPDVGEVVRTARVAIVPLRIAGGVRMKLLDLMASGVPAVSTALGARGIPFPEGTGCLRRDDPEAFATAIVTLLVDDELWMRTASAGRAYVTARHTRAGFRAQIERGVEAAIEWHRVAGEAR